MYHRIVLHVLNYRSQQIDDVTVVGDDDEFSSDDENPESLSEKHWIGGLSGVDGQLSSIVVTVDEVDFK